MRIGIFGGSFDPIHQGHLILAEQCRQQAGLDQVRFVPCAANPLKPQGARGTNRQRAEMIELAIAGNAALRLDRRELDRGGVSYTVDTLRELTAEGPGNELFLILGADSLASLSQWREPAEICRLAIPLIVGRPGAPPIDLKPLRPWVDESRWARIRDSQVQSPLIEISSTDLRARVAEQRSIRYLVPRAVEQYIQTQRLYLSESAPA